MITEENVKRVVAESPVHGPAIIDAMRDLLRLANAYNARHADFTPCDEIRYYNRVVDMLALLEVV